MEREKNHSSLFLILTVSFVVFLLLSNIIAGKLIQVFGVILPAAVILFPLTYILGDVMTEVYGFRRSRQVIWLGFAANLVAVLAFMAAVALPSPVFFQGSDAYALVLGTTPRIALASLVAYALGEFLNAMVISKLKVMTKGKHLWVRTIGSSILGQGIDTVAFIAIAFWGTMPLEALLTMILAQYLFKLSYEAVFTPVTYLVVRKVKKAEGLDVYDQDISYNPFKWKAQ